jgi:hypothetical protein
MYVKYDADYGTIQEFFNRDLENGYFMELDYIFESPCTNCSNNSNNFIGIIKDDFTTAPRMATYGFYILAALGIIFTIIEIIRKKLTISNDLATIIHSLFAGASAVIGLFIAMLLIKFISVYILVFYNKSFIEAADINNLIIICFAPILLIAVSFITFTIGIIVMKLNFSEFEKKLSSERYETSYSTYRYRGGK